MKPHRQRIEHEGWMKFPYPESVEQAANDLDFIMPGWAGKINLEEFNMASCSKCVIGQTIGYDNRMDYWVYESGMPHLIFACGSEEWITEINKRRAKETADGLKGVDKQAKSSVETVVTRTHLIDFSVWPLVDELGGRKVVQLTTEQLRQLAKDIEQSLSEINE